MTGATEKTPGEKNSPGQIRKRSVLLAGHATSVSLEGVFWRELAGIAKAQGISVNALISRIDRERDLSGGNLSSAIRVHVLGHVKRG
jgi:predicted DNA-binding ribbon-helix-helix protein